jgi:DNA-binding GntR family transcriptional regulator
MGEVTTWTDEVDPPALGTLDASVRDAIREDIVEGRLRSNERLKVSDIARRLGTSTNPVREALRQLCGEGFVVMTPNKGARVRTIDETFVRDVYEVEVLIEPHLTRWFVGQATETDIAQLDEIQREIEALNFADPLAHSDLDTRFHRLMYDRHYNRHMVELWWKHREILGAMARRFPTSLSRRADVLQEHRDLLDRVRVQDADGAARVVARHVEGSGRHIVEQVRASRRSAPS